MSALKMDAHGEIDIDRAHIRSLWSVLATPWFPDGPDSPKLALSRFVPETAHDWDGPSSKPAPPA